MTLFSDGLKKRSDITAYYVNLSAAYSERREPRRAKQLLYQALAVDENDSAVNYALANLAVQEQNLARAMAGYHKILADNPEAREVYLAMLEAQLQLGSSAGVVDTARKCYEKIGDRRFVSARIYGLTVKNFRPQRSDIAIAALQVLHRRDPAHPGAYISLGSIHAMRKEYKQGASYWGAFLQRFPHHEEVGKVRLWLEDVRRKMAAESK